MQRTLRTILTATIALSLAACGGDSSTAPTITVAGAWTGTVSTQVIDMTLVENAGAVSGSGTISNTPTGTRALTISGTFAAGTMNVTMSSGTIQPINFRATVVLPKSMAGTLTGSGFTGEVVTFSRM
jgi:hypothetical protein